MKFFEKTGKMAIGSRLRLLSSRMTDDAASIFQLYGNDLQPRWFPVYYVLSEGGPLSVTDIAGQIGHSQPSVSQILREMSKQGLIKEKKDAKDGRRTVVSLTAKGLAMKARMEQQYTDVENAVEQLMAQTQNNLWQAIEEWEYLLNQRSLLQRVSDQRKRRESAKVKIVEYQPKYQQAFRQLNEEWIRKYFKMEEEDYKALDHPKKYILDRGGCILVALYEGKPAGVCALIKMKDPDYQYELAKMAVSPAMQGKNIGGLLGQAIITKARQLGASRLYLESNTKLKPAISLYEKLGFKKVSGRPTPYERCNIQMELDLT